MMNSSLSYFIKTNPDPERLSYIINKFLEKDIKEKYDFYSTSEDFDFPLILKEYSIDFNK